MTSNPGDHVVEATASIAAPVDAVWAVVSDHARMAEWGPFSSSELTVPGSPDRDGRGARRTLRVAAAEIVEEVTSFDPPNGYGYRLVSGAPLASEIGDVRLHAVESGTELTWTIRLRPRIPGTGAIAAFALGRALRRMLNHGLRPAVEASVGRRP